MPSHNSRKRPPSQRPERVREPEKPLIGMNDPQCSAMHEAGHAVAAVVLGIALKSVDLHRRRVEGRESMGFTDTARLDVEEIAGKGEEAALPHLILSAAGPLAERSINPRAFQTNGDDMDRMKWRQIAAVAICGLPKPDADGRTTIAPGQITRNADRISKLEKDAVQAAARFVNENIGAIKSVAAELIVRKELSGDQVAEIVALAGASENACLDDE